MPLRIKFICGMEPARQNEYPIMFQVGHNGVTEIIAETENYGDHGIGWFNIYFGEHILQRLQMRATSEVRYFHPDEV